MNPPQLENINESLEEIGRDAFPHGRTYQITPMDWSICERGLSIGISRRSTLQGSGTPGVATIPAIRSNS